jgi:hypothetical protein
MSSLPEPACPYGYTRKQIVEILATSTRVEEFDKWMRGQTMSMCQGKSYNYEMRVYEPSACAGNAHGTVVYRHDLERFLQGLEPLD